MEVGRLAASDPDLGENALLEFTIMDGEEAEIFNLTRKDKEAVIVLSKVTNESPGWFSLTSRANLPRFSKHALNGPIKMLMLPLVTGSVVNRL